MKKVIALFLLASVLLLAGCSESSGLNSGVIPADESITNTKFSDYNAYLSFLEDYKQKDGPLASKIIPADRLFLLGSWNGFELRWAGPPEVSAHGQYYFYYLEAPGVSDPVPIRVEVYLQPEQTFLMNKTVGPVPTGILTDADYALSASMAQREPRDEPVKIIRNGVTYSYSPSGRLVIILMEVEGILYSIMATDYSSDRNPLRNLDESSVLGRLLSLDEDIAKEAYNEIKASLTK